MSTDRDAYVRKMEARIDQANAEIEKLKAKADEAGADAEIQYDETLDKLRRQREKAETELDELRIAGEDKLADIRNRMEAIWSEFDAAVMKT
jgi:hypothetical protein